MHKIFLVEDEQILREGMKNNINWKEAGYIFCGDASDGEEALPLIMECSPDIVITDIKMPFMNGLELSRRIKQQKPSTKIIVLTGYDEFDFAREAVSIGADEYLLKPFSAKKILDSLNQISEKINKEKQDRVLSYEKYVLEKELLINMKDNDGVIQEFYKYDSSDVEEFLKFGKLCDIDNFVEKYIEKLKVDKSNSYIFIYYIFMNLFVVISKFLKTIGEDKVENVISEVRDWELFCMEIKNSFDVEKIMKKMFVKTINYRENHKINKYGSLIEEAKSFIKKNYCDPNISLNSVAYNVHVSPNHFSNIFKSVTGESFTDFLIRIRIDKAKELLNSTTLKTYEISDTIGYTDSHYFSYIFKKITGVTPSEFRKSY